MGKTIILGSRGSPLAQAQVQEVVERAVSCGFCAPNEIEIRTVKTIGDINLTSRVSDIGGKGIFSRELEDELIAGRIDIAVHSMKDLPVRQPEGLIVDGVLKRAPPGDALVGDIGTCLQDLPDGTRIGTSSIRRTAQILRTNPNLVPVNLRGNLGTRLRKLGEGKVDMAILALAGLHRLRLPKARYTSIPLTEMLPAPAQGVIGLERCLNNQRAASLIATLNDEQTSIQVQAERALLAALGGDCSTPIGALAEIKNQDILLSAELLSPDGGSTISKSRQGRITEAKQIGFQLAGQILADFADL